MISVITYGRNDNYSFNLAKRVALGFNCLAEVLTEKDEIVFVDYNTPEPLPSLPEFIWDTFTPKARSLIKVVVVPPAVHNRIRRDSPLPLLENVSRNAGIVRSNPDNHWILCTNPDVVLILARRWPNLPALLETLRDSFYEMPRFDIPESVWSSLTRNDPQANMKALRDWLVANNAAVVEAAPDHRMQEYCLFHAPGDFQLAPRDYFLRLRGFDESMNKRFHSDENLAKRMWLLNGRRTDHLLGNLWVLHQDHYLGGEWSQAAAGVEHNDYHRKVLHHNTIEANGDGWGLQSCSLPSFLLAEKIKRQRVDLPASGDNSNGDLPLSREIDWRTHSVYRTCHYQPDLVTLYLREILQVLPPHSKIVYIGENPETFQQILGIWGEVSPEGLPLRNLSAMTDPSERGSIDILVVDCFYERPSHWEQRVRSREEELQREVAAGRMSQPEADDELSRFVDNVDSENQRTRLVQLWNRHLPSLQWRNGAYIILLGCEVYSPTFLAFQQSLGAWPDGSAARLSWLQKLRTIYHRLEFALHGTDDNGAALGLYRTLRRQKRRVFRRLTGRESIMGWVYFRHVTRGQPRSGVPQGLRPIYTHHRLIVARMEANTEIEAGSTSVS